MCYNGIKQKLMSEIDVINKRFLKFELQTATRLHEVGVASNRK